MASEKESLITALADKTPVVPPAENHAEEDYFHNTLASKLRAALWPGTFGVIDSLYIKGGGTYTEIPLTTGGSPGSGTVTGVTGTAPILSNGNTVTPNISIEAASSVNPGSMSAADKIKLDGVETNANKYVHPGSHPPSIILQDTTNRFVTDAEKATWNAGGGGSTGTVTGVLGTAPIVSDGNTTTPTMSITAATTSAAGSMSGADKTKLDGIAPNANNYVHPTNHPPSIITQDASNRFVTDTEKTTWNAKASLSIANTWSERQRWGDANSDTYTPLAANAIDLSLGAAFGKTVAAGTTFTISGQDSTGFCSSFILELTNGGAFTITWWSGIKWAGGTAPVLTASGVDILGFYTRNGGTTWNGLVLAKDVK